MTTPARRVVITAVAAAGLAFLLATAGCAPAPPGPPAPAPAPPAASPPPTPATVPGPRGVRATWIARENQRPGSAAWRIAGRPPGLIEGFADRTYAAAGDTVDLAVSTDATQWHAEAYRMGFYQGTGARLVWSSGPVTGRRLPECPLTGDGTNTVSCATWPNALTVPITRDFPPGDYLVKLVGDRGQASYVPLTVWDPASHATYLVKNDVFTWQAWNPYGGYDFYDGPGACPSGVYPLCSRARAVSYDRPYAFEYNGGQGTGDFLTLEYPLVRWLEQQGLDVAYATDVTVVDHPEIPGRHRAVLSLGHDECWSNTERQAVEAAHAQGLNVAFFGASGVLRHVRPDPSHRTLVDYRDSDADPLSGHGDPLEVTGNTWASPPASRPEEPFVGSSYNGYLRAGVTAPLHVTDPTAWIYAGTGITRDQDVPGVIGSDVDSLAPPAAYPPTVQVLAHSVLSADGAQARTSENGTFTSDMTWWTDPVTHAGVWDSGTNNWIPALGTDRSGVVDGITGNLFRVLGSGPGGLVAPSRPGPAPR